MKPYKVWLALVGTGLLLLVTGCSGGETGAITTIFEPTVRPENVNVEQLTLSIAGLPDGFVLTEERNIDNRESAKDALEPDAELKRMESWGRILGREALYDKGFLEEHIEISASMYSTESGAAEAAAFYANEAEQRA